MKREDDSSHETGRRLLTGVWIIVLAGAALGVAFNSLLLASGPKRGLAWVRVERALGSLEDVIATGDPAAGAGTAASADEATAPGPAAPPLATTPDAAGVAPPPAAPAATTHRGPKPAATPAVPPEPGPAPAANVAPPASAAASTPAAPVIPDMREPLEAGYETVKALWDAKAAVFVDARTTEEYVQEHIARARSLPLDDLGKNPDLVKDFPSDGRPLVVYCDGGECELSKNLAWNLVDAGRKKVLVFLGGIAEWKQRGAPVASGAPGGTQ